MQYEARGFLWGMAVRLQPHTPPSVGPSTGKSGVTELVEPVWVLQPSLVSRVDLPGLASSSSKQHTRNGQKSELYGGAPDLAEIWVNDTYGCELQ